MSRATRGLVLGGLIVAATAAGYLAARAGDEPAPQGRFFELRTYTCNPGKLPDLHKRFREHTCALFRKHGMEMIGFWTPVEGKEAENTLVYLLAFPSREARDKAFQAFRDDPEWQKAFKESHVNGVIVDKVVSQFLAPTDYSPMR